MFDLCTVGDLCWLVILPVSHLPAMGEVVQVQGSERLLGNDAAIVSLLAARLGLRCSLLAINPVAHDAQPLLDLLQQEGVDISQISAAGATTPTTYFLPCLGSDERAWLVEAYPFSSPRTSTLSAATFAYIDIYEEHTEERLALLERWSQAGVHCLVNLSASHLLEKAYRLANISAIDTLQMRGSGSVDEAFALGRHMLQACPTQAVVITLGSAGAVLLDQHNTHFIPPEAVQPRRTIGAGASFSAGLLYALNQGATYHEAAIFASKQAALFCSVEKNPLEVIKR